MRSKEEIGYLLPVETMSYVPVFYFIFYVGCFSFIFILYVTVKLNNILFFWVLVRFRVSVLCVTVK